MKQKTLYVCCLTLLMALVCSSCIKQDEYKKFLAGGEISYAGRADTVIVRTGNERALLFVVLGNDPLVNQVKIYWNNGNDSLITAVQRSGGSATRDTVEIALNQLSEGSYNFQLYTLDSQGNKSVVVRTHGFVYGTDYVATLQNRKLKSMELQSDGSLKLNWPLPFIGETALELVYNDQSGQAIVRRIPLQETTTILPDFESESDLQYKSLFKPDTLALDDFSTTPLTIVLPKK